MGLPIPNLDDRTFDDLLREAKSLIPIYNKEWTNHNPSDPGITLLELFAWISETTIYRVNRVSEANYRAFLRLLGIDYIFRWDGVPGMDNQRLYDFLAQQYAVFWLHPAVAKSMDGRAITVTDQKNSQNNITVSLSNDLKKITIGFNSGESDTLEVKSESLFDWDNIPGADDRRLDESRLLQFCNDTFQYNMRRSTATITKNTAGSVITVIDSSGKSVTLTLNTDESFITAVSREGRTLQLRVIKEDGRRMATQLKVYLPIARDIQRGMASLLHSKQYRAVTTEDYEKLTRECLAQLQPDLTGRVICMINRDLESPISDPSAEYPGHVSVMLIVSEAKPVCCWDDFNDSDQDKDNRNRIALICLLTKVYGIDWLASAEIQWQVTDDAVVISKKDDGNVKITLKKDDADPGDPDIKVFLDCQGSISDALALKTAKLDMNGNPDENAAAKSYLYLYTSDSGPSTLLTHYVKQYLSRRKLITTRVHVVGPKYHSSVNLMASIVLSPNTNPETVKESAEKAIRDYLDPLKGGATGNGWPLGRFIYRSEIYQLLEGVPGVDHVASLKFGGPDLNQINIESYELINPNQSRIIIEVSS